MAAPNNANSGKPAAGGAPNSAAPKAPITGKGLFGRTVTIDPDWDAQTKKLGRYYQPPASDLRIALHQKTFPQLPSDWPLWAQQRVRGNAVIGLALLGFAAGTFWWTLHKMGQGEFDEIKNERRIQ